MLPLPDRHAAPIGRHLEQGGERRVLAGSQSLGEGAVVGVDKRDPAQRHQRRDPDDGD
jgi:hypothetical protein